MEKQKNTVRLQLLMSERHHRMLERLAEREYRSLNSMMRVLIERAYMERMLGTRATGTTIVKPQS
jgi:hypothetical protein